LLEGLAQATPSLVVPVVQSRGAQVTPVVPARVTPDRTILGAA
jgi:hypothetical protein